MEALGGKYLWGFTTGLYSRIFAKIEPGDILLFTSRGTGEFSRIGLVHRTRMAASTQECDTIWKRFPTVGGGGAKTGRGGFPLMVLLWPKPVDVDDALAVVVEFGDGTAERIVGKQLNLPSLLVPPPPKKQWRQQRW